MCSLVSGVLLSLGDFADDAGVAGQGSLGLVERVGVGGDELSLVVGAAVTDDDLGAVLVGHDYGWAGKSAPVRVRVVWLQRLLSHTCMQIVSHFEHILGEGRRLTRSVLFGVDGLRVRVREGDAYCLAVFHEDGLGGRDTRVLEVLIRHHSLGHMNLLSLVIVFLDSKSDLLGGSPLGSHNGLCISGCCRQHMTSRHGSELITVHLISCSLHGPL